MQHKKVKKSNHDQTNYELGGGGHSGPGGYNLSKLVYFEKKL